jgi:hypothetical protein
LSAEELTANLAKLGASEKEAFRIGAVSAVKSKFGNDSAKLPDVTKYLSSPEVRAKVAAIMPTPQAAAAWNRRFDFEIRSSDLVKRSLGNSSTARRTAEMAATKGIMRELFTSALRGDLAFSVLTKVAAAKASDTFRSRADKEIAKILTRPARSTPLAVGGGTSRLQP